MHTWFLCGDIHETRDLDDLDVSGRIVLKLDWTGLIWLRRGISGGLF